jgi:hypothetical protein
VAAVMRSMLDGPLAKASDDSIFEFDGSRRTVALPLRRMGLSSRAIGWKKQNAPRALCDPSGRKETAMTDIDSTLDPFVEAEIKEHHAALIRQMVAIGLIICVMLIWVGLHH